MRPIINRVAVWLAAGVAGAALTGCVVAPVDGGYYDNGAYDTYYDNGGYYSGGGDGYYNGTYYPAIPREVVPVAPYVGALWVGGYWDTSRGHRRWVPGRYDRPGNYYNRPGNHGNYNRPYDNRPYDNRPGWNRPNDNRYDNRYDNRPGNTRPGWNQPNRPDWNQPGVNPPRPSRPTPPVVNPRPSNNGWQMMPPGSGRPNRSSGPDDRGGS